MKNLSRILAFFVVVILASGAVMADSKTDNIELLVPVGQPAADGSLRVEVDKAFLSGVFPETLSITLPDGSVVFARKTSEDEIVDGFKAWYGKVEGEELSSVVLVQKGSEIRGNIHLSRGRFLLETLKDVTYRISNLGKVVEPKIELPKKSKQLLKKLENSIVPLTRPKLEAEEPQIDKDGNVVVTMMHIFRRQPHNYDPPEQVTCDATSALDIALTNQALQDSGAKVKLKLIACYTAVVYNSDFWDWLGTIHGAASGEEIQKIRDKHGADLITVYARCGDDECFWAGKYPTSHVNAIQLLGYCADGYNYQVGAGVLLGAGMQNGSYGWFPYSRGYVAPADQWRTLVTSPVFISSIPIIPYYSTPLINYGGIPIGVDGAYDNVSTINQTAPIVSQYKQKPVIENTMVPVIQNNPDAGFAPLEVTFDGSTSYINDNSKSITEYRWSFGDGSAEETGVTAAHTYNSPGEYTARLTITDSDGNRASTTKKIRVYQSGELDILLEVSKPAIKARLMGTATIRAYITDDNGNLIKDKMNLSFTTVSGSLYYDFMYIPSAGLYTQTLSSGAPGTDTITASVEGGPSETIQIRYTWPQQPVNQNLTYTTRRSLFKGLHDVTLTWAANPRTQYPARSYRIYRSTDGGAFNLIGEVGANQFRFEDKDLVAGPEYIYAVTTVDTDGDESDINTTLELN